MHESRRIVLCRAGAGEELADRRARVSQEWLEHHGRIPRIHIARRHRVRHAVRDEKSANLRHFARLSTTAHPPSATARLRSVFAVKHSCFVHSKTEKNEAIVIVNVMFYHGPVL